MAAIPRRVDLALLGAFEALPAPVRRLIARPTVGVLERLVRRRPASTWLPQLAVSARWAAGTPDQTGALIRRLGMSPRTAARARRQVARLALRYGLLDAARDVLATIPEARQPDFELVRARQAVEEGRYEAARGLRAVGPRRRVTRRRAVPRDDRRARGGARAGLDARPR